MALRVRLKRNILKDCSVTSVQLRWDCVSDLITALERISDHCSNIAGCLIEMSHDSLNMHSYLYKLKHEPNDEFLRQFNEYSPNMP